MVQVEKDLDGLIAEEYIPSSVERKKALLMYFFVWIVATMASEKISIYEFFHLKQSLWRRMIFFISAIVGIIFIVVPYYLWIIPFIVFIFYAIVRVIFVKQAWEWKYTLNRDKIIMPIYAGLWWWVLSIFDLDVSHSDE